MSVSLRAEDGATSVTTPKSAMSTPLRIRAAFGACRCGVEVPFTLPRSHERPEERRTREGGTVDLLSRAVLGPRTCANDGAQCDVRGRHREPAAGAGDHHAGGHDVGEEPLKMVNPSHLRGEGVSHPTPAGDAAGHHTGVIRRWKQPTSWAANDPRGLSAGLGAPAPPPPTPARLDLVLFLLLNDPATSLGALSGPQRDEDLARDAV